MGDIHGVGGPARRALMLRAAVTSILLSECATAAVTAYLVNQTLPATGTVCEQDAVPFASAPLSVQGPANTNAGARAALIPDALARAMR